MALGKKTGGRQRGTRNKSTADVKQLASQYGAVVIVELVRLARRAENEQARVAACRELLDRAYGKASQPLQHSGSVHVQHSFTDGLQAVLERARHGTAVGAWPIGAVIGATPGGNNGHG